jgi:hypothetical protein
VVIVEPACCGVDVVVAGYTLMDRVEVREVEGSARDTCETFDTDELLRLR